MGYIPVHVLGVCYNFFGQFRTEMSSNRSRSALPGLRVERKEINLFLFPIYVYSRSVLCAHNM